MRSRERERERERDRERERRRERISKKTCRKHKMGPAREAESREGDGCREGVALHCTSAAWRGKQKIVVRGNAFNKRRTPLMYLRQFHST